MEDAVVIWQGSTRPVEFSYKNFNGEKARRKVSVTKVLYDESNDKTYLEGFCDLRQEVRTFNTRNITTMMLVGSKRYEIWDWFYECLGIAPPWHSDDFSSDFYTEDDVIDDHKPESIFDEKAQVLLAKITQPQQVSQQVNRMSLVNCKECSKEVSKDAKTCPHCGVKHPGVTGKEAAKGCLGLIVTAFAIALLAYGCEDEAPQSLEQAESTKWEKYKNMTDCELATHMINGASGFISQLTPYATKDNTHTFDDYAAVLDASNYEEKFQQWRTQYPTIGSGMTDYPMSRMAVTEITFPISQLSYLVGDRLKKPDDKANNQKIKDNISRIQTAQQKISAQCGAAQ